MLPPGYIQHFPALENGNHSITSSKTPDYNCIAWAAGEDDRWWWPDPWGTSCSYWPKGVSNTETVQAFIDAFGTLGYSVCEDGGLEQGREKVAIYVKSNKPTHMARQLEDGLWTSKLGEDHDISHASPDTIAGGFYGRVEAFMVRNIR